MEIITSNNNQAVKQARSLLEKKYRKFYGHFLLEGKKLVCEAINKKLNIINIFINEQKIDEFSDIINNFDCLILSNSVFKTLSDTQTPQGIIAEIEIPPVKEYKHNNSNKLLVLDRIADPGNMGTIIRTAKATGFNDIFVIDCVDVFSPKVVRSSVGTVLGVNIYPATTDEIIKLANKHNIRMLVADMHGQNVIGMENLSNYMIVVGNEGQGVCDEFKNYGTLIKIPMKADVESLNAGVSASVLMYLLEGENI